jgi:YfiR/HmsC-like
MIDAFRKTRTRVIRRTLSAWLCGLLALTILAGGVVGTEAASEYQIKAVFLFNFSHFVEWPPQAFTTPSEPFVIGVLGDDPFGTRLDDVVRNERIGEHPLVVRRFRKADDIGNCQILFIDRSESARVGQVVESLNHREVLTVSETDGAAEHGAMIQFATDNSHIRLRINAEAARSAGLVISSKLLHLAEIVGTKSGD